MMNWPLLWVIKTTLSRHLIAVTELKDRVTVTGGSWPLLTLPWRRGHIDHPLASFIKCPSCKGSQLLPGVEPVVQMSCRRRWWALSLCLSHTEYFTQQLILAEALFIYHHKAALPFRPWNSVDLLTSCKNFMLLFFYNSFFCPFFHSRFPKLSSLFTHVGGIWTFAKVFWPLLATIEKYKSDIRSHSALRHTRLGQGWAEGVAGHCGIVWGGAPPGDWGDFF